MRREKERERERDRDRQTETETERDPLVREGSEQSSTSDLVSVPIVLTWQKDFTRHRERGG